MRYVKRIRATFFFVVRKASAFLEERKRRRNERKRSKKFVYFIHIRKTAGTSMRSVLRHNYSKEQTCPELSQADLMTKHAGEDIGKYLDQFRLVSGHYYTLPKYFITKREVVTILREPIARTISEINQIRNDSRDLLHAQAIALRVEDMFTDERFDKALKNSQTRFLVMNANAGYAGLSDGERVAVAKKYLDRIAFVGLTEQFDLSVKMMCTLFGWSMPMRTPQLNRKITAAGIKDDESLPYRDLIEQHNTLDVEVYEYAKQLFERRVNEISKKKNG